jgi:hypothetical protein
VFPIADTLPWLVPGTVIALVASILGSPAVGRWLNIPRSVAWLLLFSLGVTLAITISPLSGATVPSPGTPRTCNLSRTWPPSPADLLRGEDVALNVLMLVPLGVAIGFMPMSRRKLVVVVAAIALPPTIELIQLLAAELGRACQGADVADNVTGLAIGIAAGAIAGRLTPVPRRKLDGEGTRPDR